MWRIARRYGYDPDYRLGALEIGGRDWRLRAGDIRLDQMAAEAETARAAGLTPRVDGKGRGPLWGLSWTVKF